MYRNDLNTTECSEKKQKDIRITAEWSSTFHFTLVPFRLFHSIPVFCNAQAMLLYLLYLMNLPAQNLGYLYSSNWMMVLSFLVCHLHVPHSSHDGCGHSAPVVVWSATGACLTSPWRLLPIFLYWWFVFPLEVEHQHLYRLLLFCGIVGNAVG